MARFLPRTFRSTHEKENGHVPPVVQPGQTLPRINTSRTISPIVVREEDDVTVSVEVFGNPSPKVTWYIGKVTVTPSYEYQMKQRGKVHYLTILNVSEEIDEGLYVVASNVVGRVKKKLDVKLYRVLSRHSKSKPQSRSTHKSTGTLETVDHFDVPVHQRYKSFGSFGKFETLIDGDPTDEIVEDLDVKLRETLKRHKSTPNIYTKLPSNTSSLYSRHAQSETYDYHPNNAKRCQTLPDLNGPLSRPRTSYLAKSTESVHNELSIPCIPALTMEFGEFSSQRASVNIPQSPLREEGNVSLSELDFYQQYSRHAQGDVSTFMPEDNGIQPTVMKPSATSSFHERSHGQGSAAWDVEDARLASVVQGGLQEYHPDQIQVRVQNPSLSQGYVSYDSQVDQSTLDNKHNPYGIGHDDSVLAGNLSHKLHGKKQPKVPPKPKEKKSKKKKDVAVSSNAPQIDSGAIETECGAPTYENVGHRQSPTVSAQTSDNLKQGYHPDHNSSAILYAPDGTMFSLPMDGEFNPALISNIATDKESVTSHSEQHSFVIMPNESINLSHGDSIQPHTLSVFGEGVDIDNPDTLDAPVKQTKKKVVRKVKKRTKSVERDGINDNSPQIITKANSSAYPTDENLDLSRGSNQSRCLPPVPAGHEAQNIYEDIPISSSEYQHMEYSPVEQSRYPRPSVAPKPRNLKFSPDSHSVLIDPRRQLNMSYNQPSESPHHHTQPQGNVSMYDFDTERHSSSFVLRASTEDQNVTQSRRINSSASSPVARTSPGLVDITGGHYIPMDGSSRVASFEQDVYEDVHRSGGRRPTQPPPPPPTYGLPSPPSEEPPPIPTSDLPPSPQLTIHPALPGIQVSDIDIPIPFTSDIIPHTQGNFVGLDYSVPVPSMDEPATSKVRKTSHRKLEGNTESTDGTSLPKKPKVAKKPKYVKEKSLNESPNLSHHEMMDTDDHHIEHQPQQEINIDNIYTSGSSTVQLDDIISPSAQRIARRAKRKSRSKDIHVQPQLQEIWIDGVPEAVDTPLLQTVESVGQTQNADDLGVLNTEMHTPLASTPKSKIKRKKRSSARSTSEMSMHREHGASDVNVPTGIGGLSFHETNLDEPVTLKTEPVIDPSITSPTSMFLSKASVIEGTTLGAIGSTLDSNFNEPLKGNEIHSPPMETVSDRSCMETVIDGPCMETDIDGPQMETNIDEPQMETNIDRPYDGNAIGAKGTDTASGWPGIDTVIDEPLGDTVVEGHSVEQSRVSLDFGEVDAHSNIRPVKKKKKKITRSVGDISELTSLQTVPIETNIDGTRVAVKTSETPQKKIVRKKKKLNKSTSDLNAETIGELQVVDINIDSSMTVDQPKKKMKKKKITKSVGDLSSTLPLPDCGSTKEEETHDTFYDIQTLERPKKKVRKVKQKTKSLSDLSADTVPQLAIVDINIDENHEMPVDDLLAEQVVDSTVKRRKKKKKITLPSDSLLSQSLDGDMQLLTQTVIDETMSDIQYENAQQIANINQLDLGEQVNGPSQETIIDALLKQPEADNSSTKRKKKKVPTATLR